MTVDDGGCRMSNSDDGNDKDFVWQDSYSKEDQIDSYENDTYEASNVSYRKWFSTLMIIGAVGFLILVVLSIFVISRSQNYAEKKQILAIEKKLDRLETDFTSLKIYITSKLDQAIKEMERDEQTAAKQKRPPAQKEQTDVKPKVHKIQAGDSLYLISRQYGLTIEHLRDYNNLEPNAKIYPGQELKLTP